MEMTDTLPPALAALLDGRDPAIRADVSGVLMTVDEEGWPHAAFLSAGEVLAHDPRRFSMMLWAASHASANIERTGSAALFVAAEGVVWEARLRLVLAPSPDSGYRIFHARVIGMRRHQAPYAEVTGLIGFRLLDPAASLARWQRQIERMREIDDLSTSEEERP